MTEKIDSTGTTLVNAERYWKPITGLTPRGVKCFLINRAAKSATTGTVATEEKFFTHYFPLPVFDPDEGAEPVEVDVEAAVAAWLEMERKAAMFDAIMRNDWLRPSAFHDSVWGWKEKYLERVDAEVACVHPAQTHST